MPPTLSIENRSALTSHEVVSADGTTIAAHWSRPPHTGAGDGRPVVVLAADLAEAVPEVWRPQLEYLSTRPRALRFVTWDYRGTGSSQPGRGGRYDVAAHVEDLWAVLTQAGVPPTTPFVFVGTGVGVRIALETALIAPARVSGLVLIGGAAGLRYDLLCRASWLASVVARQSVGQRARPRAALMAAATHGVDHLMQLAEMSLLDPAGQARAEPVDTVQAVAESLRELGTAPVLAQARRVHQPALVLCGEHDPRMPAALAHQLARHLAHSRVILVPRSRSRLAARLPDLVNLELEKFIDEVMVPPPLADA